MAVRKVRRPAPEPMEDDDEDIVLTVGRPRDELADIDRSNFAAVHQQQIEAYGLVARGFRDAPTSRKLWVLAMCLAPFVLIAIGTAIAQLF